MAFLIKGALCFRRLLFLFPDRFDQKTPLCSRISQWMPHFPWTCSMSDAHGMFRQEIFRSGLWVGFLLPCPLHVPKDWKNRFSALKRGRNGPASWGIRKGDSLTPVFKKSESGVNPMKPREFIANCPTMRSSPSQAVHQTSNSWTRLIELASCLVGQIPPKSEPRTPAAHETHPLDAQDRSLVAQGSEEKYFHLPQNGELLRFRRQSVSPNLPDAHSRPSAIL